VYPKRKFSIALPGGRTLELGSRTLVMGIINVTPDSFSDGGVLFDPARAIEAGVQMVADGADVLDVGGESTRPGAQALDAAEERRRVLPVIEGLVRRVNVPVSVDTYKASIARAALEAGAALVNDVSGLRYEPDLAGVVAQHKAAIILMHTRGRSRDMYKQAVYSEVVDEVLDELRESIAFAAGAGIPKESMLIDPGLGFAKEAAHSYEVLARLAEFSDLGRPVVAGPSRKGFLTRPLSKETLSRETLSKETLSKETLSKETSTSERAWPTSERDWSTAAAVSAAVLAGAHIVRVHAVREMIPVVRVADEIRKYHREH
jgi:dihydropteroate synthase